MDYLLLQILLFLILAAVIGFFLGWITRGYGFESRLLTSENQWRSKHHSLQNENSRLQSELDQFHEQGNSVDSGRFALENTQARENFTAPFTSILESEPRTEEIDSSSKNHPLDRLRNELNQIEEAHTQKIQQAQKQAELFESDESIAPEELHSLEAEVDELTKIMGIGPKIESTLNQLGITQYRQIAELTEGNVKWLNQQLDFSGRVERENWVEQARELIVPDPET